MKSLIYLFAVAALTLVYTNSYAQTEEPVTPITHGTNFVDADGNGYNDNAPDADGDGIPNGVDPDYTAPGMQHGKKGFVDADGDGINDNAGQGARAQGGYGPKGGTGNQVVGPQDCTGNGVGNGTATGTGSQVQKRNGKK